MDPRWFDLMPMVEGLVKEAGSTVAALRQACRKLPPGLGYGHVWYNPDTKVAWVSVGDWEEDLDAWRKPLAKVPGVKEVHIEAEAGPPGLRDGSETWLRVKQAHSPTLRAVGQLATWVPGPTNALYGGPSPLAAALASGLLGAGVGYGAGWLGEQALPREHFRPGHLRKVLALLGAGVGTAPALWWGAVAHQHHPDTPGVRAWLSSWPFRGKDLKGPPAPEPPPEKLPDDYLGEIGNTPLKTACDAALALLGGPEPHYKRAVYASPVGYDFGVGGLTSVPMIPADHFSQVVWSDPNTPVPIRSATTGLVDSASALRRGARLVSPADIGRVAVGMGSGYASGLLVGKTLGALAGLRPESQKKLQQAGTWAGLLTNLVPLAFG